MQPWFTLALCVSVIASQALGLPRASPESDGLDIPAVNQSGEDKSAEGYPKLNGPIEEQKRYSRDSLLSSQDEGRVERGLEKDVKPLEDTPIKVTFPEDSKAGLTLKEDDDSIRSKKSTSVQDAPHLTTVCIQVRSNHPSVLCGPQVDDMKDLKMNQAARSSMGDNMFYRQQLFGRSSLAGLTPSQGMGLTPSQGMGFAPSQGMGLAPSQAQGLTPSQIRFMQNMSPKTVPSSVNTPSAANGPTAFQVMRSEDQTIDAHPPSGIPAQPGRGGPQTIPAGTIAPGVQGAPVVVHTSGYKPGQPMSFSVPFPYQSGASPYSSPGLRLNCLTDYAWPAYGPPMLRSAASQQPQLVQIGDQLVAIPGPSARMSQDSLMLENPGLYLSPHQARSAHPDQMVGSSLGYSALDSLLANTFIGEDGQVYFMDESQARAASDQVLRNIMEYHNFQRMAPSDISKSELDPKEKQELIDAKEEAKKLKEKVDKLEAEKYKIQKEQDQQQEDPDKKKSDSGSTKKRQTKSSRLSN